MKKNLLSRLLAVVSVAAAAPVMAAPVDLSTLTVAVDFSTATAAILTVAGAVIVVYIAIKASGFVIGMVKRG